jgi:hypothetical protein
MKKKVKKKKEKKDKAKYERHRYICVAVLVLLDQKGDELSSSSNNIIQRKNDNMREKKRYSCLLSLFRKEGETKTHEREERQRPSFR